MKLDGFGDGVDDPVFADAVEGVVEEFDAAITCLGGRAEDFDDEIGDGEFEGIGVGESGFGGAEEGDVGFVVVAGEDAEGFFNVDNPQVVHADVSVHERKEAFGRLKVAMERWGVHDDFTLDELPFEFGSDVVIEFLAEFLFFDQGALGFLQNFWEYGTVHQGIKDGRVHGWSLHLDGLARKWGWGGRAAGFLTGFARFRD